MTYCYCGRQAKWGSERCHRCEEEYRLWEEEEEGRQAMVHWLMARMDAGEEAIELSRRKERLFKLLAAAGVLISAASMIYLIIAIFTLLL